MKSLLNRILVAWIASCAVLFAFIGCDAQLDNSLTKLPSIKVSNILPDSSEIVVCANDGEASLSYEVIPSNATGKVAVVVEDQEVATVQNGIVRGFKTGKTSVTLSSGTVVKTVLLNVGLKASFDGVCDDVIYTVGKTIPVESPVKDGSVFRYWWCDQLDNLVSSDFVVPEGITSGTLLFTSVWDTDVSKKYTVTFDSNGGSSVSSASVQTGAAVTAPSNPTKQGFQFAGWYADSSLNAKYDFASPVTQNITLYAKWVTTVVPVTGISVSYDATVWKDIKVKDNVQLVAAVSPSDATDASVVWSVTGDNANVSTTGLFSATASGSYVVKATSVSNPSVFGYATINVSASEKVLESLIISGPSSVKVGESVNLTAQAVFDDGSKTTVTDYTSFISSSSSIEITTNSVKGLVTAEGVTITGSFTHKGVTKTSVKTISVEPDVEDDVYDGIRIYVAQSLGYNQIHYWSCEDKVAYPSTTWPGTAMTAEGSDYVYKFAGVSSVKFLITKGSGTKLTNSDLEITKKGDYRVTSSGVAEITKAKPFVSISPSVNSIVKTGTITVSVTDGGLTTSVSANINGTSKTLAVGTNTISVSSLGANAGDTIRISVTATNSKGSDTKSASYEVVDAPVVKVPSDVRELRIYQVMVSSFQDGDPSIGYKYAYGPQSAIKGGDLQGIINALDYIQGLGCNALWMTPIFNSNGEGHLDSTGYYAYDYFNVDPKFGTNDKFRELVTKAHDKGIAIILDGVFGHHKLTGVATSPNGNSTVTQPGKNYNPVDYTKGKTLEFFKEVAAYWITNYKIDGWRFDQDYQVGGVYQSDKHNYWKEIRETIEAAAAANGTKGVDWGTLAYMVGEDWQRVDADIQKQTVDGAGLPSAFDFPARYKIVDAIAEEEWNDNDISLGEALGDVLYASASSRGMNNTATEFRYTAFLTNHDTLRFGDLVKLKYKIGTSDAMFMGKTRVALSCLAGYSGPFVIFYGDEWGAIVDGVTKSPMETGSSSSVGDGAYWDNASRSTGKISGFSSNEQKLIDWTTSLMNMRAKYPIMWKGTSTSIYKGSNYYVGQKTLEGKTAKFIINDTGAAVNYDFGSSGTDMMTGSKTTASVSCPAYSAVFVLLD